MLLVPDLCWAPQIYRAILQPCAKMILWSSPSHILQAAILLPICFFALGPESNEHAELQYKSIQSVMYPESGLHLRMASGADPDIWLVSQIQES